MSGFERILARVGGDALRDYCSSAIEDELKSLKGKMQSCLESVEKALEVQDAIHKLNVPLSDENVATFAAIQSEYQKFAGDLGAFIQEQRQIQASQPAEAATATRARTDSVASSVGGDGSSVGLSSQQRLTKLATKIQHRLSKKHSSTTWIGKNVADMEAVATVLSGFVPEKAQRRELVLALDHFISAVLLSPATQTSDFRRLDDVLKQLETAPQEIAEFARNSRTLVVAKLDPPATNGTSSTTGTTASGSEGRRIKRQRIDQADDFFVKVERQQQQEDSASAHEVRVSDLPWGASQPEVESYFGVAGRVLGVRMPTMDDGSTVGVAIVRFATLDGASAALRMDGYHFQGRSIRVALPEAV